jgi:CBS domain containing-hemolysin-like protein
MIAAISDAAACAAWGVVLVASLAMSALYAGMETGIYVLNKIRLDLNAEAGDRRARLLRNIIADPNDMLAVLLIGNNIASYLATFAASAVFVLSGAGHRAGWYALALAAPALFVFGESVPKNVFRRLAETLAYRLAWMLGLSGALFSVCGLVPMVRAVAGALLRLAGAKARARQPLGHEGVAAVVAEGHASGALTHLQTVMADRVMKIAEVTLHDVMIPMSRAVTAPREVDAQRLIAIVGGSNYSRLPLLDDRGMVAGILNVYDALTVRAVSRPADPAVVPLVLSEDLTVTDALYRMQRGNAHMAVVQDVAGKHVGIVTIKDLVEEIVGEIEAW